MSLTPRLDLRQTQTLAMTPRLQQAIRLLQMSALELESAVAEELEKNPFLEREGAQEFADPAENREFSEFEGREDPPALLDSAGQEEAPPDTNDVPTEDSFYEQAGEENETFEDMSDFLWIPGREPERQEKTAVPFPRLICAPRRARLCMTLWFRRLILRCAAKTTAKLLLLCWNALMKTAG